MRPLERLFPVLGSAILIADLWMPDMTGLEFLVQAHRLHPDASRRLAGPRVDYLAVGFRRAQANELNLELAAGVSPWWLLAEWSLRSQR